MMSLRDEAEHAAAVLADERAASRRRQDESHARALVDALSFRLDRPAEFAGWVEGDEPFLKYLQFGGETVEWRHVTFGRVACDGVVFLHEKAKPAETDWFVQVSCVSCGAMTRSARGGGNAMANPLGYGLRLPVRRDETSEDASYWRDKDLPRFITEVGVALKTERRCGPCFYGRPRSCRECGRVAW